MEVLNNCNKLFLLTIIVSVCLYLMTCNPGNAQITSQVVNISPVTSDRDGSNPNSASGGRVNQLATHPTSDDIFFSASEWGGLYRTTDAGRNWIYVPGHRPQAMWDVKISPANANIVVATSFFDGKTNPLSGINISRDGGVTWVVPPTARPDSTDCSSEAARAEPAAFGIAFDPADPGDIYVGTNCGLAISNDTGVNWNFVDPTPSSDGGLDVWDVIVHNGGTIDICGDDGHQRSTNGGTTFVAGAPEVGGTCTLAVSPNEANVLFMSVGTQIFETRDAGATWPTSMVNPGPQGRIPFLKVNDRSGQNFDLWYGDTQLFRAACTTPTDTASDVRRCPANSWSTAQTGAHWDVGDIAFDTDSAVDACPILFSNDGGVYFNQRSSSDCHDPRWEQPTQTVKALWLWDMDGNIRTTEGEEGVYMGQQDSGAFGTRDGAKANRDWNSPTCCDVFDVEAEDSRVIYSICCYRGGRSTRMFLDDDNMDGGQEIPNYPTGSLVGFRDTDSLSNYASNSYAVITSSGIFFTTNIGAETITWQNLGTSVPPNICGVYSSIRNDGTPVFTARAGGCGMGQTGELWQHVGAMTTGNWVQIQRDGQNQFGTFGVNPTDPDHIIANDLSDITPTMVRTTNGGDNWTVLSNLNTILTGNNDFLLQTQTEVVWGRPGGNGYPQASLVAISPLDHNMIIAGGQDSGVFLSVDGGDYWQLLTDPRTNDALRPHISRPLFAHFEPLQNAGTNVYIGARGRGAWRITLLPSQTGIPAITDPSSGSTLTGPTVTFNWSANGTSVEEWYLGVGTTLTSVSQAPWGDIHAQSHGLNTSSTVIGLPADGRPVYVRLWYMEAGAWLSQDFQYTAFAQPGTPAITDPSSGSTLTGPTVTFNWSANGTSVEEWYLGVGTTLTSVSQAPWGDIHAQSHGLNTSSTVSGLPADGRPVYVRLWYMEAGAWLSQDFQYTASN